MLERVRPIKDLENIDILYVEDEDEIRETLANILRRHTKSLHLANNGAVGLEMYKELMCDIVLSDIQMPVKNGLQMIREIKEINPNVKVIITTAFGETEYLLEAIELEVSGYLIKPINKNRLFSILNDNAKNILFDRKEKKLQTYYQQIMDFQKNMVLILEQSLKCIKANSSFMKFFNIDDIESFEFSKLNNKIVKKDAYIEELNLELINKIVHNADRSEIILFEADDSTRAFVVNVSEIINQKDTKEYIISFTDITILDRENKKLEVRATVDKLTNIFNRDKFSEMLKYEIEKFKRYSLYFSLIFFDIDHFKSVNDTFGHDIGDFVLKEIASLVQSKLRDTDTFARWGGEEFIILLPNTDLSNATKLAERLREAIAQHDFQYREITSSFGVTEIKSADSEDSLIKRVDENLYNSKNSGRNRVTSDSI